jgi:hypothetical protein
LSAEFLARYRARLDAIGPWRVAASPPPGRVLSIFWGNPCGLRLDWAAFELVFDTDEDSPTFDPDDRMFDALEAYRPHHDRLTGRLRETVGTAKTVLLEVQRLRGEAGVYYLTLARVYQPGDDEPQLFELNDPSGWFEEW